MYPHYRIRIIIARQSIWTDRYGSCSRYLPCDVQVTSECDLAHYSILCFRSGFTRLHTYKVKDSRLLRETNPKSVCVWNRGSRILSRAEDGNKSLYYKYYYKGKTCLPFKRQAADDWKLDRYKIWNNNFGSDSKLMIVTIAYYNIICAL